MVWELEEQVPEMLVAAPRRVMVRVENFILAEEMVWLGFVEDLDLVG